MTREDIIEMAQQTGWDFGWEMTVEQVCDFANLVAAAERNKLATWMMTKGYATGHGDTVEDLAQEVEWQVRESEREAFAKLCEQAGIDGYGTLAAATMIKARGEK